VLWSKSLNGKCAKLHTVAASNNRDHPTRSLYYCLFTSYLFVCSSLRTSRLWWIALSTEHQLRGCNNVPSFLQWTAPIAHSFCKGCTWHHLHTLVKAPLCCDWKAKVAGVTFSDSDSAPVAKFLNPGPDPAILQIWESDSCSDSGYNHPSNRNLPMFLPKQWPHGLLLLPKWKKWRQIRVRFSQIFDSGSGSGSEIKTQKPTAVDSSNPDPVPPLLESPGGKYAKLHTAAASNSRDPTSCSFYFCLFATHIYGCCSSRPPLSWRIAHSTQH